jgi:HSP20 family molecular chaperone IbpA
VPANIDPSKIQVTCKDRDVIVQAEEKLEKEDGISQTYYYRRSTLPETTNFDDLKCVLENNQLSITAPIDENLRQNKRKIPIQIEGPNKQEALNH